MCGGGGSAHKSLHLSPDHEAASARQGVWRVTDPLARADSRPRWMRCGQTLSGCVYTPLQVPREKRTIPQSKPEALICDVDPNKR